MKKTDKILQKALEKTTNTQIKQLIRNYFNEKGIK